MLFITLSIWGLVLASAGLLYNFQVIRNLDRLIFLRLNNFFSKNGFIFLFRFLWPLGTSLFIFSVFSWLLIRNWRISILLSAIYLLVLSVESILKTLANRQRPYSVFSVALMRQPLPPSDTSFPSGDCVRIWYLSITLSGFFNWDPTFVFFAIMIALLVALGRIALGVHYPLDVIAGSGLGIMFAGFALNLVRLIHP